MCPRSAERFEQIKDERRRALLRAARVVFGRKGFAAAKIADIAAQAGISHGLVYHYYPEKESLFSATVEAFAACQDAGAIVITGTDLTGALGASWGDLDAMTIGEEWPGGLVQVEGLEAGARVVTADLPDLPDLQAGEPVELVDF